jgi:hypothetical protein
MVRYDPFATGCKAKEPAEEREGVAMELIGAKGGEKP